MRIRIVAAGKARAGPEGMLCGSYLERFGRTGRGIGLGPASITEFEAGPRGKPPLIAGAAADRGIMLCILDVSGPQLSSRQFASFLADCRDSGKKESVFVIGGANGLDKKVRESADACLSLGKMVFPSSAGESDSFGTAVQGSIYPRRRAVSPRIA